MRLTRSGAVGLAIVSVVFAIAVLGIWSTRTLVDASVEATTHQSRMCGFCSVKSMRRSGSLVSAISRAASIAASPLAGMVKAPAWAAASTASCSF